MSINVNNSLFPCGLMRREFVWQMGAGFAGLGLAGVLAGEAQATEGDNPMLGLILCSDKNDAVVKYTLGEQQERNIFASRYQLHLPTVEELENELRRELRYLTISAGGASVDKNLMVTPKAASPRRKTIKGKSK